jgi:RNA polymerase sigma-70 factor (ECF subfamily)
MTKPPGAVDAGAAYAEHRSFLWGLLYRMTGSAADADDLVHETFVRALERPPRRRDAPLRPWLTRVALNLGRDLLRRRRRRAYVGPWLPTPVDTADEPPSFEPPDPGEGPAARYDRLESVSFAFLLALEALRPAQRAVLLLRDVLGESVRETAAALDMTEVNVKTTHRRARQALAAYDRGPRRLTAARQRASRLALERFLACLAAGDAAGLEALLAQDVRSLHDAGGEFRSALRPILGRDKVARLYLDLARRLGTGGTAEPRMLNGLPALIVDRPDAPEGLAPRFTLQCDVDGDGRIACLYVVLATRKLAAVSRVPRQNTPRIAPA